MTPKNWKTFQHYTDRKPAWVKLHRALLDDYAFACLPLASQALAPRLWLLASEYADGKITADLAEMAFRLHVTVDDLTAALKPLVKSEFFIDDSGLLADGYQPAIPEKERERQVQTERETESRSLRSRECANDDWPEDFRERFWQQYPRKVGRKPALTKLDAIRRSGVVTFDRLMAGVAKIPSSEPRFIPHPTTWLNRGGWDDEVLPLNGASHGQRISLTDEARQLADHARELERQAGIGR